MDTPHQPPRAELADLEKALLAINELPGHSAYVSDDPQNPSLLVIINVPTPREMDFTPEMGITNVTLTHGRVPGRNT